MSYVENEAGKYSELVESSCTLQVVQKDYLCKNFLRLHEYPAHLKKWMDTC